MKYIAKAPTMGDAIFSLYGAGCGGPAGGPANGPLDDWVFADDSKTPPTQEQVDAKIKELQIEFDAQEYARDRAKAYPSIQDQMDMQYHDAVDGTTTWQEAVQAVKDAHPKPE